MVALEALAGRRIGPSWELVRPLARGGMSAVYLGRHAVTQREVAVKVLDPKVFADPAARDRFVREVTAPVRIRHPGIVEILDAGTDEALGAHFVVMELLEGHELRRELDAGPMPPARAAALVDALLDPLAAAHRAGLVHRDLKPENVFLAKTADGTERVKILDFGIARDLAAGSTTSTSSTFGTPHYMAPEQIQSTRSATPAADVWAVGAIFHEMLAGAPPFEGETAPAVFVAVATQAPPPLSSAVPAGLRRLVTRCLDKDPRARPADAAALRAALREASSEGTDAPGAATAPTTGAGTPPSLGTRGPAAAAPDAATAVAAPAATTASAEPAATTTPARLARGRTAALLFGLLAIGGLVALWLSARGPAIETAATAGAPPAAPPAVRETSSAASVPTGLDPPALGAPAHDDAAEPASTGGARGPGTERTGAGARPSRGAASAPPTSPATAPEGARVESPPGASAPPTSAAAAREGARVESPPVASEPPTPATTERETAPPTTSPSLPDAPTRAEVVDVMQSVAPAVRACGLIAHGPVTVTLTVAGATGSVTDVSVSGDLAGTPVVACIARAVRSARFARFARSTFTVSYPFRI